MVALNSHPQPQEDLDRWKRLLDLLELLLKIMVGFIPLAPFLIKGTEMVFKWVSPDKAHNIAVIIIYALACILTAIFASVFAYKFSRKHLTARPRPTEPVERSPRKRLSPRWVIIITVVLYLAVAVPASYMVSSRTDFWHLVVSVWRGPQINLAAAETGETFQPAVNLPWFNYGQDFGQVPGWDWKGVSKNRSAAEACFSKLCQSGVKCVLWFLLCDGRGSLKFDSEGSVTGIDPTFWEDYDAVIKIAREYRVAILWVLVDWKWMQPAQQKDGASLFGHADIITDSQKRESFFKNALIPILRRYPYESQIAGWIIINEPENALKEGYVSSEAMQEFTRKTASLVKQFTSRQPVSIGSADLESLMEHWEKDDNELDFLVFHHYGQSLPPPVPYIQSLAGKAGNKPIYIGEYDIKKPPVPIKELVTWSVRLGYAGIWPWSLNAPKDGSEAPAYDEAQEMSEAITATRGDARRLREEFQQRHQLTADSTNAGLSNDMKWWCQHWSEKVIPQITQTINQAQADIVIHEREYLVNRVDFKEKTLGEFDKLRSDSKKANNCLSENQRWLEDSQARAASLRIQVSDNEDMLGRLNDQLKGLERAGSNTAETRSAIRKQENELGRLRPLLEQEEKNILGAQNGIKGCKEWVDRINKQQSDQERYLRLASERENMHRSQANWKRYWMKWDQVLYQKFWEGEEKKCPF